MPHPKGLALPPPEHHQEFEVLCLELLKAMKRPLVEPNLFGRSGQAQHGVDFALQLADGLHGYQCKRVEEFAFAEFEAEVAKTVSFPNPLQSYTVLATTPNDAHLESEVAALSLHRVEEGGFPVGVVFWPTIRDWLADHSSVARAHYGSALSGAPRKPLTVDDHRELEALLARHRRKRMSAPQVVGHLKAKGYSVEKMADVYALVAEYDIAHPAPPVPPEPSFADRIRAHAEGARVEEQRAVDAREKALRAQQLVEASYDGELGVLIRTCREVATEAAALLGEGRNISIEPNNSDTEVLATYQGFSICVRHHRELFNPKARYAQVVVTRRQGWRRNDVDLLSHPQIPLVARGDELAWSLHGRPVSARLVAEWMVEELLRLGHGR